MIGICRVCGRETEVVSVPILYDKPISYVLLCEKHKDLQAGAV